MKLIFSFKQELKSFFESANKMRLLFLDYLNLKFMTFKMSINTEIDRHSQIMTAIIDDDDEPKTNDHSIHMVQFH